MTTSLMPTPDAWTHKPAEPQPAYPSYNSTFQPQPYLPGSFWAAPAYPSSPPPASPHRSPVESWTDRYLPDPIGNKNPLIPVDKPLKLNPLQNFFLNTKTVFVTTPRTVLKGLRGDRDFNFADFMLVSRIPYYMGGVFLVLAHVAPKSGREGLKSGIGVGLYYLANQLTDAGVNGLYWMRYGIPLGLKYKSTTGRIEPALNTADFPRTDILTDEQYNRMAEKMGIPSTVADPKAACNDQIRKAIISARAMKLVAGNLLAAVGAGYIAKHSGWGQWFGKHGVTTIFQETGVVLKDPKWGNLFNRLNVVRRAWSALVQPTIRAKINHGSPTSGWVRPVALGTALTSVGFAVLHSLTALKRKQYEASPTTFLFNSNAQKPFPSAFSRFGNTSSNRNLSSSGNSTLL